jgi:tetratricopeptide (TPR) repeat protein
MLGKAKILFEQQRFEDAIEVFDGIVERVQDADPDSRKAAVLALNNKTAALNRLDRVDEAIAAYQQLIDQFAAEAIAVFDDTISRSRDHGGQWQRENLAGALAAKATLLIELDRQDDALPILSELIATFQGEERPLIAQIVNQACDARDQLIHDDTSDG